MSKIKSSFFCQNCGYESVKWAGQCPSCQQWNTFVEEVSQKKITGGKNNWNDYHAEKRISRSIASHEVQNKKELNERIESLKRV
nr:DNA repair protein RadA [Chitinophagaceae bacterium]